MAGGALSLIDKQKTAKETQPDGVPQGVVAFAERIDRWIVLGGLAKWVQPVGMEERRDPCASL
ncbi:MAG: hypothetical protein O2973_11650 [Gemmatimonadetes bacterium]|nr:hypothetical protein [Gemmatimonadota bacterium]